MAFVPFVPAKDTCTWSLQMRWWPINVWLSSSSSMRNKNPAQVFGEADKGQIQENISGINVHIQTSQTVIEFSRLVMTWLTFCCCNLKKNTATGLESVKGGTSTLTSSHVKVIQRLVLYIQLLYPATKIHNFSLYIIKTDQVFWESKPKKHLRGNCSVISPGFNLPQRSWSVTAPWRTDATPPLCSRINIFNSHFHSVWNLLVELKPQTKAKNKQTNKNNL